MLSEYSSRMTMNYSYVDAVLQEVVFALEIE